MKKLTKKQKENIEFNNGFITAIGLFLAHERDDWGLNNKLPHLTLIVQQTIYLIWKYHTVYL